MLEPHSIQKSESSVKLLGCTPIFFKNWLEHQFDSNMNWGNYGSYWHIDHVIPCSSFHILDSYEQRVCFNWKNCRPLEGKDNLLKNNKIIPLQILLQEIRVYYFDMQQNQIAGNS